MEELTEPELRILEAARKVFERDGYAGARMQHIADEAGISKASLHYYFRSKEKLFQRIFDEYITRIVPVFSAWNDDGDDWQPKVRTFMKGMMKAISESPMLLIAREFDRDPSKMEALLTARRKKPNAFAAYFERLSKAGLVRNIDPRPLIMAMQALCAYPYMNKAFLCAAMRMDPKQYNAYLDQYTDQAADIIIRAMKK
jgi:AcrR family transcriptional regulator